MAINDCERYLNLIMGAVDIYIYKRNTNLGKNKQKQQNFRNKAISKLLCFVDIQTNFIKCIHFLQ